MQGINMLRIESDTGKPIWVNPLQITYLKPIGDTTRIYFSDSQSTVDVKPSPERIASALRDASYDVL